MPLPSPYAENDKTSDDESDDEDEDNKGLTNDEDAAPAHMAPVDRETGARRLAVRLRRPFGALLLAPKVAD